MKRAAWLCVWVGACVAPADGPSDLWADGSVPFEQAVAGGLVGSELPPPTQSLTLNVSAMVPGSQLSFDVQGLNPGESYYLARGMGGLASGLCLGQAGGLCLDIGNPVFLIGRFTADASGVGTLNLNLPATVPLGSSVAFQAVAIRGVGGDDSSKSNPVLRSAVAGSIGLDDVLPGDLVITEVMQNPYAVSDSAGEWFEVYNGTGLDIDLNGLEVSDSSGASFIVNSSLVAGAGAYAVFARNGNPAVNGGVNVDYVWTSFGLGNTSDDIILSYGGVELDRVGWDDGASFPDPVGASMGLSPDAIDALLNNDGSAWCESSSIFGDGDFGTPGTVNDTCEPAPVQTCSDGLLNQDETGVDCGGVCPVCVLPSYTRDEDFETGALDAFPYVFEGPNPWTLETNTLECYEGSFCLRTSPTHGLQELSSISVPLSVREDTEVSFWARTTTEPGQHYFRFFVDGVLQLELTGQTGWTQYIFPVLGTGPNGPDRVLRFEYERSDFVDPSHVPWNQVWVDSIDMPSWNTPPTVPVTSEPWNGLITTTAPTFSWASADDDFDTITYEMQYADNVNFTDAVTTGETFATSVSPGLAAGTWYWRVRSKDDSDYRWSDWSPTWSLVFDSTYSYDLAWRQTTTDQFAMNDLSEVFAFDNLVAIGGYDTGWSSYITACCGGGWQETVTFTGLPTTRSGASGLLEVEVMGDFGASYETFDAIRIDGSSYFTGWWPASQCGTRGNSTTVSNISSKVNDGRVDIVFDTDNDVSSYDCSTNRVRARLSYGDTHTFGMMTSVPISFTSFGPSATVWDKLQWVGGGDTTLRVLDADLVPLPETVLPGNAAGFTRHTVHLFDVDPNLYPVLHLQAEFGSTGRLDEWRVTGGDKFVWEFDYAGELEGWEADDLLGVPTLDASAGVLRFDGDAAGIDPNVQFWFDQAIAADRFSRIGLRVRSSNNYFDDTPTLHWASNFGAFDDRRSFAHTRFLFAYQDVVYDLTAAPPSPQEPWQGMIEALRFDPVDIFVDQVGDPADGWFEIERIELF